jgi:glutathione S-transferase
MSSFAVQEGEYTIYGMFCSYFTKKLETYFLVKGIPYKFVELDSPGFAQYAEKVGVMQIPLVECPDGTWLSDTTPIIQEFEDDANLVSLRSKDPLTAFCSYFLEDAFDEWLWAPALYYRWAFKMDQLRRADEFTYTIMANGFKFPRAILRQIITQRQKSVHLKQNGITSSKHARHIEELYIDILDLLQPVLKKRPYLFGDRPSEADIGLQGPMFPHFSNDPTSQEIMQDRGPHVFRWVARLWSTRPEEIETTEEIDSVPEDLQPLLTKMANEYLPYLVENKNAYKAKKAETTYDLGGLKWHVVTSPYRVYCLAQLQTRYQALTAEQQVKCAELLGDGAVQILDSEIYCPDSMKGVTAANPAVEKDSAVVSRHWQKKSKFETYLEASRSKNKSQRIAEKKGEGAGWLPIYFNHHRAKNTEV